MGGKYQQCGSRVCYEVVKMCSEAKHSLLYWGSLMESIFLLYSRLRPAMTELCVYSNISTILLWNCRRIVLILLPLSCCCSFIEEVSRSNSEEDGRRITWWNETKTIACFVWGCPPWMSGFVLINKCQLSLRTIYISILGPLLCTFTGLVRLRQW